MSKRPELKATLNLPRTSFSMKANLPQREPEILDWWDRVDVYGLCATLYHLATLHAPYAGSPQEMLRKLNMVIGAFFSEVGGELLELLEEALGGHPARQRGRAAGAVDFLRIADARTLGVLSQRLAHRFGGGGWNGHLHRLGKA